MKIIRSRCARNLTVAYEYMIAAVLVFHSSLHQVAPRQL